MLGDGLLFSRLLAEAVALAAEDADAAVQRAAAAVRGALVG